MQKSVLGLQPRKSFFGTAADRADDFSTNRKEMKRYTEGDSFLGKMRWDLGVMGLTKEWLFTISSSTLPKDLLAMASITCVAVPLNLAIGIASGVPPEVALITAGVSAPVAALMGGTRLAVTGPAAAISVLVAQAVNHHGLLALPFITFSVGVLQVISGMCNAGWMQMICPVPVIAGFTTGVGALIGVGQLTKFLGLPPSPPNSSSFDILYHVGQHISETDPLCLGVGAASFAVAWGLPKLHKKAAGAGVLAAVATGTGAAAWVAQSGMGSVKLVGEMPPLVMSELVKIPTCPSELLPLVPTVGILYALCSVESLISCTAVDKARPTVCQYDPSQELIGQGLANMAAGCVSGMPVTSVIARSSVNLLASAQTRASAGLHGLILLGGYAQLAPIIAMVPYSALSAVLMNAGSKMLWPAEIQNALSVRKSDAVPYAATVIGMLSCGLSEGVMVGMVFSLITSGANWDHPESAFLSHMEAQSVRVALDRYRPDQLWDMTKPQLIRLLLSNYDNRLQTAMGSYTVGDEAVTCPECGGTGTIHMVMSSHSVPDDLEGETCPTCDGQGVLFGFSAEPPILWLNGPLNFLSIFRVKNLVETIKAMKRKQDEDGSDTGNSDFRVILDLQGCGTVDMTGAEALLDGLAELKLEKIKVSLMNAPKEFGSALTACSTIDRVNVFETKPGTKGGF